MIDPYHDFTGQLSMLLDDIRNAAYERAIQDVVNSNSIVMDLGAGLGIHGLMAARAGAKRVYLVEPSPVLKDVQKVVEDNGWSDRVVLINEAIENVEFPEKVDVIVSVLTGNFLVEEDLLPKLFFARDRHLTPGGVLLPEAGRMCVVPVMLHEDQPDPAQRLSSPIFGIDYSSLHARASNSVRYGRFKEGRVAQLAAAQTLQSLDFTKASSARVDGDCAFEISAPGRVDGFLGWFDMNLAGDWLSTGPDAAAVHWSHAFLPLANPLTVERGDAVKLVIKRPERGDWTWTVTADGETQRMSTFFGRLPTSAEVANADLQRLRRLGPAGASASFVLTRLREGASLKDLEQAFLAWEGRHTDEESTARDWLRNFLEQFGS